MDKNIPKINLKLSNYNSFIEEQNDSYISNKHK